MSVVISNCGAAEASVATNHGGFKLRWFVMVASQLRKSSYSQRANNSTGNSCYW